tara:strand:+ start:129 stop:653 length:525 start_codon:yes stop_codon:yes gene_type:complete
MKIRNTKFNGLKVIKGKTFYDKRGFLREILRHNLLKSNNFIFWIASKSKKNTIRGLHIQRKNAQAKFVCVLKGKIYDVALDLRKKSKTYGKYFSIILSEKNSTSIFIPPGFAHGFCSLDKESLILYGMSNYRSKKYETGILWNDSDLKIKWPIKKPIISKKDRNNITFKEYKKF